MVNEALISLDETEELYRSYGFSNDNLPLEHGWWNIESPPSAQNMDVNQIECIL